ncbi:MAG: phosphopyruvate hydratase, partial [Oscillospiraceae bacterium]|nr:phosphopyruvate hydratase [Oscillospiraceae bacterium]
MNYNPYLITKVIAREILDSRSNPTVEADVFLSGGAVGRAAVPSGASTGRFEAKELRDKDTKRFMGCGVLTAVENVNNEISQALIGCDARCQKSIDEAMLALDGTENKERLGANAILAVSLACARAAAKMGKIPLYRYLGGVNAVTLPVPMMNILNGGVHASNNLDVQEFMIIPIGFGTFSDALRCGSEVYHALRTILKLKDKSTAIGDEGGFAPDLRDDSEAIELILAAVEKAGYRAGSDVVLALDAAASEWQTDDGDYLLPKQNKRYTSETLAEFWISLCEKYPIVSIED